MHFMEIDKRILVEEFKNALAHSAYLRAMVDSTTVTLEVVLSDRCMIQGTLRFEMSPAVRGRG